MTGIVAVLVVVLVAELWVRQGATPLATLGKAASGELVLR